MIYKVYAIKNIKTGQRYIGAGYHWVFVEEGDNNGSNTTT